MDQVLNWIGQGSAVALATAVALGIVARARARDRYIVVWVAMLAVLALPLLHVAAAAPRDITSGVGGAAGAPLMALPVTWWTSPALLLLLWAAWAAVALIRLTRSFVWVRRVMRTAIPLPATPQARLSHWRSLSTRGRRTSLVVSSDVRSAAVVGCGRPVVAIAPALLDTLAADELDRIVIHEWAHVQRRDDQTQLLQACIRVVAGWHPAVWWLDRQLTIEREIACDELAVAATGSAKAYASTLVKLASLPATAPLYAELAAIAPTGLGRRVDRILGGRCRSPRAWRMAAAAGGLVVCVVASVLADVRPFERLHQTATSAADVHLVAADTIERPAVLESSPVPSIALERLVSVPARVKPGRRSAPAVSLDSSGDQSVSPSATPGAGATGAPNPEPIGSGRIAAAFAAEGAPSLGRSAERAVETPWRAAAAGGVAVGRQSREAAAATAGYFTRLGKRIGGSF